MASTYEYITARRNQNQPIATANDATSHNDAAAITSNQTKVDTPVSNTAVTNGKALQPGAASSHPAATPAPSVATTNATPLARTASKPGDEDSLTPSEISTTTWTPHLVGGATTPDPESVADPSSVTTPEPQKTLTYTELFKKLNPYEVPNPKDDERLRKKRKREAIISAIGDGLTSLANVYYTTRGALDMGSPQLSPKSKERWDKIAAERKANEQAYRQAMLRAAELDKAADDKAATDKATAARENAKWEWERQYKLYKAQDDHDKWQADTEYKKQRDRANAQEKEKDRRVRVDIANKREAGANRRAANKSNGSNNKGMRTITLNNGSETVTAEYPATKQGALRPFAQKIKQVAQSIVNNNKSSQYIKTPSGNVPKRYYQDIIDKIDEAKGSSQIMSVIEEYAADFPQLYNDFVKVLGESDDLPYARGNNKKKADYSNL